MRKLVIACLALAMMAGCAKEKLVTEPCGFDVKVNWVKGSRVEVTITPDNNLAYYSYGVMAEEDYVRFTESEVIDIQLEWMTSGYSAEGTGKKPSCTFADMYFYQGERTIRITELTTGQDYRLLVFQLNPETNKVVGPLYKVPFQTLPVEKKPMSFRIECSGSRFVIIPEDQERTWFWEYERDARIFDQYGSPAHFFTSIIDMYYEYDFLQHLISKGAEGWLLPDDDRSIREDEPYTLAVSGCSSDGELTSDLYYADFVYHQGAVTFTHADFPVVYTQE